MPSKKPSQEAFVYSWFKKNPNRPIPHSESKAAIEASYRRQYGERLEDSDRAIRKLGQEGKLIREAKGIYRYAAGCSALAGFSRYASNLSRNCCDKLSLSSTMDTSICSA